MKLIMRATIMAFMKSRRERGKESMQARTSRKLLDPPSELFEARGLFMVEIDLVGSFVATSSIRESKSLRMLPGE